MNKKCTTLILISILVYLVNSSVISCGVNFNSVGVPRRPPRIDIGSYMVYQNFETIKYGYSTRDVYIYWREINEIDKCGTSFEYRVFCTPTTTDNTTADIRVKTTFTNVVKFEGLNTTVGYTFAIYSSNEYGLSKKNSTINVPSETDRNTKQLSLTKVIIVDDNVFELSWKNNNNNDETLKYDYTLFWCEKDVNRPFECNGYLNWTYVPGTESSYYVIIKDRKKQYHFAISENTRNSSKSNSNQNQIISSSSGGMNWESCTVLSNKLPGKIENIHINKITSTSVEMYWKFDCFNRITSVHGYHVTYCPIVYKNNIQCEGPSSSKTVDLQTRDADNTTSVVINRDITTLYVAGLKPTVTYMFSVSVITCNGESLPDNPLIITTRTQGNN